LAACTSGGSSATATPEVTSTPTSEPSPAPTTRTPFIIPTPTPTPVPEPAAATVLLVDVRDGSTTTLVEDFEERPSLAEFIEDGGVRVGTWSSGAFVTRLFDLDGTERDDEATAGLCVGVVGGAEVDGRRYEDAGCGPISPDGRWMTYQVAAGDVEINGDYTVPTWDQWVVELETDGRRLLRGGLRHCGGCDFRFGPEWSPSGRYLVVPELLDGGFVYLSDVRSGATRNISDVPRPTMLDQRPTWSPVDDRLLRPAGDGSTILEDLEAGTRTTLANLPWPAAWDGTGTLVYSPAWGTATNDETATTVVVAATTGEVIATLDGAPSPSRLWGVGGAPIVPVGEGGLLAAMAVSPDCSGTIVHGPGTEDRACLEGAVGAQPSPDGRSVAFARRTGTAGAIEGPGLFPGLAIYEIAVYDVATGETTVVADGAIAGQFPDIVWNDAGTHILIRWPNPFGL
jgi:hypothetical protein